MAYKSKLRFNKGFNINNVVKRVVSTILALYVGGSILTEFGTAMNGTTSGFYTGLTLIGWTVSSGTITATTTGGVLTVVGIVAIAQIVTEFISW